MRMWLTNYKYSFLIIEEKINWSKYDPFFSGINLTCALLTGQFFFTSCNFWILASKFNVFEKLTVIFYKTSGIIIYRSFFIKQVFGYNIMCYLLIFNVKKSIIFIYS